MKRPTAYLPTGYVCLVVAMLYGGHWVFNLAWTAMGVAYLIRELRATHD